MSTNTEKRTPVRDFIDDQNYKAHAENGVHYLTDTNAAPVGSYYGFIVAGDSTTIASITYIDSSKQTGDITALTLQPGTYHSIPGGFSTITLASGNMTLLKQDS